MSGRPSRFVLDMSAGFALVLAIGVVYLVDVNLPQASNSQSRGGGAGSGRGSLLGNPIRSDSIYAQRAAPKKQRVKLVKEKGGTAVSEKAVRDGLDWLSRHQKNDGSWSRTCLMAGPDSQCDRDGHCSGPGSHFDMAHTGLVVLAFQGGGHFHFNKTKYSQQVRDGLEWIVKNQKKDGGLYTTQGHHLMYEHGIATFALLEACALDVAAGRKPLREWRQAAERAVRYIEKMQHNDGGWRYTATKTRPSDTSVSGWQVLALKTALEAGIDFDPQVVPKAKAFFESCEQGRTGITNYTTNRRNTHATTGVGMLAHQFLFGTPDSRLVKSASGVLADFAEATYGPRISSPNDYYLWYNCTLAMFQAGGENWKRWNGVVRDKVVGLQEHDGCARGSWPPNGRFAGTGGRIYSTALAVLSLEVYYRFRGTRKKKGRPKGKGARRRRGARKANCRVTGRSPAWTLPRPTLHRKRMWTIPSRDQTNGRRRLILPQNLWNAPFSIPSRSTRNGPLRTCNARRS
ncbi:MAG: prenyltransferase/squalene oxidase repeat-containing protein [Planctomycetaceae bacterium]